MISDAKRVIRDDGCKDAEKIHVSQRITRQSPTPRHLAREVKSLLAYAKDSTLAAAVGIDPADLDGPEATIPLPAYYDLLERAAAVTGDPHFGMHFAMHLHDTDPDGRSALGFLMRASPNLRTMCDRLIRYQRSWNSGDTYEVVERGDQFSIQYRPWGPWRAAHIHMAEKTVASVATVVRSVDPTCRPLAVRFAHGPNGDPADLAAVLGVPPMFGAASTEIVLPVAVMDKPIATADPDLFGLIDRYLTMRIREVAAPEASYVSRVRRAVEQVLSDGHCSQATVARILGWHGRTLQRRLASEGTTLRKLVDEVRKALAQTLLESTMSIAEVSFALGYSEPAAFQHAFRRWYGMSPNTWRNASKCHAAAPVAVADANVSE